ncbi:MAG: hypothetical protein AAFQ16_11935 [Pseudomonadota bacterium]
MTEAQIWFAMLFSIPFIPAIAVFNLIPPEKGDAQVGGKLPIFKDLSIRLAGSIATYVVIVILGIISYMILTTDRALVFRLKPVINDYYIVNRDTQSRLSILPEVWENPPNVSVTFGEKRIDLTDFQRNGESDLFVANKKIYVTRDGWGNEINLKSAESAYFSRSDVSRTVGFNADTLELEIEVREHMVADWIANYNRVHYDVDLDQSTISTRKVLMISSNARIRQRAIKLGTVSVSGIQELNLVTYQLNANGVDSFKTALEKIKTNENPDLIVEALNAAEQELLSSPALAALDDASWSWEGEGEFVAVASGSGQYSKILFAPTPGVRLPVKATDDDEYFVIVTETIGSLPSEWVREPEPVSVRYEFPTEFASITVSLLGQSGRFDGPMAQVVLETPKGDEPIDRAQSHQSVKTKSAWADDLLKSSKMIFPTPWLLD